MRDESGQDGRSTRRVAIGAALAVIGVCTLGWLLWGGPGFETDQPPRKESPTEPVVDAFSPIDRPAPVPEAVDPSAPGASPLRVILR